MNKYINHLPSIKETKKSVEVKRDFSPRYESAGELDPELAYVQVKGQSAADLKAKKPPKFVAQSGKDPKAQRLMAVSFAKLRNFEDALSMADQAFQHIQDILQQNEIEDQTFSEKLSKYSQLRNMTIKDDSVIDDIDYQSAEEAGYNSAPKHIRNPAQIRINTKKGKKLLSTGGLLMVP